jgi:glyoxylase I family protein
MRLEHVALNVPEPVEMANWYVRNFNMKIVIKLEEPPFVRFLTDATGSTAIELYANEKAPVPEYANQNPAVLHIAFAVDDPVKEKNRLLRQGCIFIEEIKQPNGSLLIMMRDPWGIPLQLVKRADEHVWY